MDIPSQYKISVVEPPITSYIHYASPLSLIYGYENAKKWFCGSYVQLYTDFRHLEQGEIKFRQELVMNYCPFLRFGSIDDYRFLLDKDITIDKLKNVISNNYALAINIDRYYIPSINKKYHLIHPVYVYGYDDGKEEFNISDFVSESGKFIFTTIPYQAMQEALNAVKGSEYIFKNTSKKYFISFYDVHDADYEFDIIDLKHKLNDYLNAENTIDCAELYVAYNIDNNVKWGLGVYEWLTDYIENIRRNYMESRIDHRPFYVLLDHKKAMKICLHYLESIEHVYNAIALYRMYDDLMQRINMLLNLVLKFNVNHDEAILGKIIRVINEVASLDKDATKDFINNVIVK